MHARCTARLQLTRRVHRVCRPAQPLLAPSARARLVLAPHVPAAALEGLEEFSHVWVLYIFHANTNLGERLGEAARASSAMAKVHVRALRASFSYENTTKQQQSRRWC